MPKPDKPAEKCPEEFERFEELTRRLVRVPKREVDDAVKRENEERRKPRTPKPV